MIILNLLKDFPSNSLNLVITGKEVVSFKKGLTKIKEEKKFFNYVYPIFTCEGEIFEKGQYNFPFSFKLPENLPSSFFYSWNHSNNYGKIYYNIYAGMKNLKT